MYDFFSPLVMLGIKPQGLVGMGSCYVTQTGLGNLGLSGPPATASLVAGIIVPVLDVIFLHVTKIKIIIICHKGIFPLVGCLCTKTYWIWCVSRWVPKAFVYTKVIRNE
jgi:hypothetical protein